MWCGQKPCHSLGGFAPTCTSPVLVPAAGMARAHTVGGAWLHLLGVVLPKGCADHETCSSVLFTLPLEHLESLTLQGSSPHCCRSAGWAKV